MSKKNKILKCIIFAAIFVTMLLSVILYEANSLPGVDEGIGFFRTYTVESNILMAVVSGVMLFLLLTRKEDIPSWAYTLQLTGTSVVIVTFVTVIIFLAPMQVVNGNSPLVMIEGSMLYMHLINPILAFVAVAVLPDTHVYSLKECVISIIPTVLYSFIYGYNVVILKAWPDFYGFTFGGKYYLAPVMMAAMYVLAFTISLVIRKVHKQIKI